MSLARKTLFVTGASRGIGLAIALRAARDGANVAIARFFAENIAVTASGLERIVFESAESVNGADAALA